MISGSPGFPIQSPVQKSGILFWQHFKQIFQVDFTKKFKIKQKYCPRICGKDTENCSEITNHSSIDSPPEGNVNMRRRRKRNEGLP